jgi:hypothetical protein
MAFMDWSELEQGLRKVVTRAMTDPTFREVCLQDPASAYTQANGIALPQGFPLRFTQGGSTEFVVSLPEAPVDFLEIPDQELDNLSGGCFEDTCWLGTLPPTYS